MKKCTLRSLLACLAALVALSACSLVEDASRLDLPAWEPQLALPLVSTEVSLGELLDLLPENDYLQTRPDGLLTLVYDGELLSLPIGRLLLLPDLSLPMPDTALSLPFPLALSRVSLKEGRWGATFTYAGAQAADLSFRFESLLAGSAPLVQRLRLPGPGSYELGGDMAGTELILSEGLRFSYSARHADGSPARLEGMRVSLSGMDYSAAWGHMGQIGLELGSDSMALDLETPLDGSFSFSDPSLTLEIRSSLGIPLQIQADDLALYRLGGQALSFQAGNLEDGIRLGAASQPGAYSSTFVRIDRQTSNLPELLTFLPQALSWSFSALTHPSGNPQETGFLTDSSELQIAVRAELPLQGRLEGLTLRDTFGIDPSGWPIGEGAGLSLALQVENAFPLDLALQVLMLSEQGELLDSLFTDAGSLLPGAPVDSEGNVSGAASRTLNISLDAERMARLRASRRLALRTRIATSGQGSQPVRVQAQNRLGIQLGLLYHP
jgi:hypothetical protein